MDKGVWYVFDLDPQNFMIFGDKYHITWERNIYSISHGWEIEIHIIHVILFDFKYIFNVYVTYYLGMLYTPQVLFLLRYPTFGYMSQSPKV